jgi:DNA-binding NarL/FixJ family response regulator
MPDKFTALDFNGVTQALTERDMTSKEISDRSELASEFAAKRTSIEQARESAIAKLAALGLTEAEIAAL